LREKISLPAVAGAKGRNANARFFNAQAEAKTLRG
jgi:hypothetical protein